MASNLSNYRKIIKNSNVKIKKEWKINKNVYKLLLLSFLFVIYFWMFINLLIIPQAQFSTSFVNITAFYKVKFSSDFSSYSLSLTTNGILLLLSWILLLFFTILYVIKNKIILNKEYKFRSLQIIAWTIFFSMFFVLFVLILIFPNLSHISNVYSTNYAIDTAIQQSVSLNNDNQTLISVFTKYNWSYDPNWSYSELVNGLLSHKTILNGSYVLFSDVNSTYVTFNSSIIAIYVFFSIPVLLLFVNYIVKYFYNNKISFPNKVSMDDVKNYLNIYKQHRIEKKQIKQNMKKLIDEENKLLQNLYEVEDPNISENDQNLVSKESLEEKINKNNELKKELENLVVKKQELKQQSLNKSRIKKFINKLQDGNVNLNKNKKQEIAVPDKELEEIFRSLDID